MKIYATKMYYSLISSRNHHKAASTHSFTSFRRDHCYVQTSPCSYVPENPQPKYHGTEEKTKRSLDLSIKDLWYKALKPIEEGDVINLQDLLFTKDRDYLVRYKDDQQVKATQLAGKVIVLYFVKLDPRWLLNSEDILALEETYTYLLPDNVFEVVLVAYETENILSNSSDSHTSSAKMFEAVFSFMPWTAIPFSDMSSREYLLNRFCIDRKRQASASFVIDSSGMVLQSKGYDLFDKYGGLGYPFTNERIQFLNSQVVATVAQPSLKALLASPKRDYLISNKGDKVLIDTLEGKTVALYFYEEGFTSDGWTEGIKMVYEEFGQNNFCFEVVLVYLYDTYLTRVSTSEESFWNAFKSMPWLAIPFKDPKCRELRRYFGYPFDPHGPQEPPKLVIIGPSAKFIEPWGDRIIFKFKHLAYPFTREKLAELDTEKVRELKLEMLWDSNTLFRRKDGSEVRFSQLVGKRIMLFFEGNTLQKKVVEFLFMLKERYLETKNTSDEFEVIYITNSKHESPCIELTACMEWFVAISSELLSIDRSLYCCYCHLEPRPYCLHNRSCFGGSSILAFDQDGKVVRKLLEPSFDHIDFPFCARGMQEEAFSGLNHFYNWSDLDFYYQGLLINSYYRKTNLRWLTDYY